MPSWQHGIFTQSFAISNIVTKICARQASSHKDLKISNIVTTVQSRVCFATFDKKINQTVEKLININKFKWHCCSGWYLVKTLSELKGVSMLKGALW